MEKRWRVKPSFSSKRISLDIKVSEIRGYPFKIIPSTGTSEAFIPYHT
jgi:hypothetical protein